MTFSIRNNTIRIEKSRTHGSGVFANARFETGDFLGTILKRIAHTGKPDEDYFRTAMGRYINHSDHPNTNIVPLENNRYGLTASHNISKGEELFINYEDMAKITGIPFQPFSKRAGMFQAPPEMVKRVWEWVLPRYAALVYQNTKDIKLKELAGKDCDFQPEKYQDFETTIPLSLEGWKYYDEDFQTALEEWKDMWSDIKVLMFATYEPEYVGKYTDTNNTIDIVLDMQWLNPSPGNYEMYKKSIHRNIEHEVIHLGQYIFKHFKNLEFGGIPSRRIRDITYTPEGQYDVPYTDPETGEKYYPSAEKLHPFRDIEFYSILNDAKIELQRQLERWPGMDEAIFKRYVGLTPSFQEYRSAPQQFFLDLKELEPEKWQKAVKELYKTITAETKMLISKRAKEKLLYEIKLQPTENQLEYFLKHKGIPFHPFEERPNPSIMVEEKNDAYYEGVEDAFQFALNELRTLAHDLGFKIINDNLDYTVVGENIYPAYLTIEADPYTADQLKNHPVIRGVEEKSPLNEVYL